MLNPLLFNLHAIQILSIDFPDLSSKFADIILTDLISASFFHEDLLVTNLQKNTQGTNLLYTV